MKILTNKFLVIRNFDLDLKNKNNIKKIRKIIRSINPISTFRGKRLVPNFINILRKCQLDKIVRLTLYNRSIIRIDTITKILDEFNYRYNIVEVNSSYMSYRYIYNLTDYEELCPQCKGFGQSIIEHKLCATIGICYFCKDKGYVNWIEKLKNNIG